MSRFFVDRSAVLEREIEITDKDDIRHITKVLRLKPGDFVDISDSAEYEYRAELMSFEKDRIVAAIHDKQSFSKEPALRVSLYQGIPKQGKMETIIQKTVELGINRIIPVFTKRTVVTEKGNFEKKLERWQKIADEAVKQCKRGLIPQIEAPVRFSQMLETVILEHDLVLFLYENEEKTTIKDVLRSRMKQLADQGQRIQSVALIIGPEGGFSDEEAEKLDQEEIFCATLGKTVLRTETAGIAALSMVMYELEL